MSRQPSVRRGTTCRAPTNENDPDALAARYEQILKSLSLGVIALGIGLGVFRFATG